MRGRTWTNWLDSATAPLLFGLLAASVGSLLFGETVGSLLAVSVGMLSCEAGRSFLGAGGWGAKAATLEHFLKGSIMLQVLYGSGIAFAVVTFLKLAHATWRAGLARANADFEFFHGRQNSPQV